MSFFFPLYVGGNIAYIYEEGFSYVSTLCTLDEEDKGEGNKSITYLTYPNKQLWNVLKRHEMYFKGKASKIEMIVHGVPMWGGADNWEGWWGIKSSA